ncbi:unnamed protein product [Orchesella dallaii]|uniref:F-box domain-containing protein n=1 Tax=Orchesella dallaii TaxID=48710 RepID=A0ABP1R8J9_9HEXA
MPGYNWFGVWKTRFSAHNNPRKEKDINELEGDGPPFPPEMVETILGKIGDLKVLLKCRLVCQEWNTMVCALLVKQNISHWTNFLERNLLTEIAPVSPLIEQKASGLIEKVCGLVSYPPALQSWKGSRNPFPAKSLTICRYPCLWKMQKPMDLGVTNLHSLFFNFGHLLSTLKLVDVDMRVLDLRTMLNYLPNLKALTINLVLIPQQNAWARLLKKMRRCQDNRISPSLAHLEIFWYMPTSVAKWLLDMCAHQLNTLSVSTSNRFMKELCKQKFVNLKQLHILSPAFRSLSGVWPIESAPLLETLTIMVDTTRSISQYRYAANFIGKFSSSLVTLCVNAKLDELENLIGYWEGSGIEFKKLKSLTLGEAVNNGCANDAPEAINDWKQFISRRNALRIFPNILSVKFKTFRRISARKSFPS